MHLYKHTVIERYIGVKYFIQHLLFVFFIKNSTSSFYFYKVSLDLKVFYKNILTFI